MITVEPEWDDDSRDAMLALAAWEESLCPLCGGPRDQCQDPEAEWRWKGAPPTRCHRTDAVSRFREGAEHARPEALLWHAEEKG